MMRVQSTYRRERVPAPNPAASDQATNSSNRIVTCGGGADELGGFGAPVRGAFGRACDSGSGFRFGAAGDWKVG